MESEHLQFVKAVQQNPGYDGILAPSNLNNRYIFEDIPFGLVPFASLARIAGIRVPVMNAAISMASALHGLDYRATGRTAENMGIAGMDVGRILDFVVEGDSE